MVANTFDVYFEKCCLSGWHLVGRVQLPRTASTAVRAPRLPDRWGGAEMVCRARAGRALERRPISPRKGSDFLGSQGNCHGRQDRGWHKPLWPEHQETFRSSIADFANVGPRGDCAITAACFLSRFTKAYP